MEIAPKPENAAPEPQKPPRPRGETAVGVAIATGLIGAVAALGYGTSSGSTAGDVLRGTQFFFCCGGLGFLVTLAVLASTHPKTNNQTKL